MSPPYTRSPEPAPIDGARAVGCTGLLATWRTADPIGRREPVLTLVDKLHLQCGRIVDYTRRD